MGTGARGVGRGLWRVHACAARRGAAGCVGLRGAWAHRARWRASSLAAASCLMRAQWNISGSAAWPSFCACISSTCPSTLSRMRPCLHARASQLSSRPPTRPSILAP